MNLKMTDLKRCLEAAGFKKVKTILSSGNAAFDSTSRSAATIERQVEAVLTKELGRSFHTIVRSVAELNELIEADPFAAFDLTRDAKKVVTFARKLRTPKSPLPLASEDAQILSSGEREAFSAYVPGPRGPVFMELIKSTFGSEVTTRTWETVKKCAKA